jgi:hypothetical protein
MREIPYDPTRKSLYQPEAGATILKTGGQFSEELVCAEAARLVYKKFERQDAAAEEIRQALSHAGFGDLSFFSVEGTSALAACNAETSTAIVAFRGAEQDPTDILIDLKGWPRNWPAGGKVHEGFYQAFNRIKPSIESWIAAHPGRLLLTGHSLGAALATLATSIRIPTRLLTFGSPRVGNDEFVSTLRGIEILRYVDCCDIVTQLPPEVAGFSHCGDLRYIDQMGNILNVPPVESITEDRVQARVGYTFAYSWRIGSVAVRDLADHSPINYVSALQAAL